MKKRFISVALCTALIVASLSGCGDKQKTPDEGDKQNNVSEQGDAENGTDTEGEEVTITIGVSPAETSTEADIERWEAAVAAMKEKYPNVTVEEAHYDYAPDTFVALAESGNLPTLYGTWYTETQKLIDEGYAADITEEMSERGWIESMNPSIRSILSDAEEHIYGVPITTYGLGIMINAELFEQAGLVDEDGIPLYPATWQELAETAKKIKEATGEAGLVLLAKDNSGGWHFSNIAWAFGANLVTQNEDGSYVAHLDSAEAIEAMEFVKSLKWEYDVLTADPTVEDWGTGFTNLAAGTAAMYIAANDAVQMPISNGMELENLAMYAFPAGPNGDQYSLAGGTAYMFSPDATEAQIKAALDFVEIYGYGPSTESVKGYENEMKAYNENGNPVLKPFPIWDNEELVAAQEAVVGKYGNVDERMFNNYFEAVVKDGNLRTEEPGSAQDMYAELTKVLQEVLTNEDSDVSALMKTANDNYQQILDGLQ